MENWFVSSVTTLIPGLRIKFSISISIGIAGIFIETHDNPDSAPSDGPNMLHLNNLKELILKLKDFDNVAKS